MVSVVCFLANGNFPALYINSNAVLNSSLSNPGLSPSSVGNKRSGYIEYLATIIGIILVVKTGPRFIRIIQDNYL